MAEMQCTYVLAVCNFRFNYQDKYSCPAFFSNTEYLRIIIIIIGLMSRVFASSPGDQGSIPGRVILKILKMVLDAALLNTQHYEVRVKWSNPGNGVTPSPTHRCSSD